MNECYTDTYWLNYALNWANLIISRWIIYTISTSLFQSVLYLLKYAVHCTFQIHSFTLTVDQALLKLVIPLCVHQYLISLHIHLFSFLWSITDIMKQEILKSEAMAFFIHAFCDMNCGTLQGINYLGLVRWVSSVLFFAIYCIHTGSKLSFVIQDYNSTSSNNKFHIPFLLLLCASGSSTSD